MWGDNFLRKSENLQLIMDC